MKATIEKYQQGQQPLDDSMNFHTLQNRVDRLAIIVDEQAEEIEGWKGKY